MSESELARQLNTKTLGVLSHDLSRQLRGGWRLSKVGANWAPNERIEQPSSTLLLLSFRQDGRRAAAFSWKLVRFLSAGPIFTFGPRRHGRVEARAG